jgi:hypothetical protein
LAQPTFEQFFRAIAEQESGGNYSAVGVWVRGDRAYGKYQVMGANIPSWTAKYVGKSMTPTQYLNSPSAQEAVARGRLKEYYNKYGARGAASAWYSGNPNLHMSTRSQTGGPSIKGYVDSVISKSYKYPASGGGSASTSTAKYSGSVTVPKLSKAELREQYGFTAAFLKANPEVSKLFDQMVKGEWTKDKFQAKLRNTKWWKSHSKSEKDYLMQRYTDPATAKQTLSQAYVKVRQLANQMGLRETPGNKKRLDKWAYNMAAKGWDEGQLRNEIGKFVYFNDGVHQGEGGEIWDELHSYAYDMGVTMSGQWYADKSRNVVRGIASIQDYKNEMQIKAKAQYSFWSKQIDAGQTVADIAQPYMQTMSQILELPAGSINLFDTTIKKALNYTNSGTMQKEAKPLWQFENELRKDPRWRKTQNAQDGMMQVAHQVLADFGLAY